MKILCSSSNQYSSYYWDRLIGQLQHHYDVDSADIEHPSKYIRLYGRDNDNVYEAEVTKYSNGEYVIPTSSINKIQDDVTGSRIMAAQPSTSAEFFSQSIESAYSQIDSLKENFEAMKESAGGDLLNYCNDALSAIDELEDSTDKLAEFFKVEK